jgi:hypothetical protein
VHQFRFAGFPGRGGIRRTVSKPTEPLVDAKDPDSEVGPFYRFYYLRERGISSDMMPEDIWKNLIAIGIVDEQSAEEYFRSDRPVTTLFLDRAVAEGMPVQHALFAIARWYSNERVAEEAMGLEINNKAPKLPNARKREVIGKRVNELVSRAIHQLVPILENRVEDSVMTGVTGQEPFDIVEDPLARAVGSKLAEDVFTLFPWFDVFGSGSLYFYGLKKQPMYNIEDHPAWKTFLLGSTLLRGISFDSVLGNGIIRQVSGGFYHIVIDCYEDLQRTAVAGG